MSCLYSQEDPLVECTFMETISDLEDTRRDFSLSDQSF
jgi:hypothetical protein